MRRLPALSAIGAQTAGAAKPNRRRGIAPLWLHRRSTHRTGKALFDTQHHGKARFMPPDIAHR